MVYVAAFNVPPRNRNIAGDFHRPYGKPLSEGEREEEILIYPPCHNHGGYRYPGESRVNDKEEIL